MFTVTFINAFSPTQNNPQFMCFSQTLLSKVIHYKYICQKKEELYIYSCRYSKDIHRNKCRAIARLTRSLYTTEKARIRRYTILSTIFMSQYTASQL